MKSKIKGLFGYRLLLKTENRKYYSKIIFKCVNNAVGPSFNENFAKFRTCESRKQCIGPTNRDANTLKNVFSAVQTNTKTVVSTVLGQSNMKISQSRVAAPMAYPSRV